MFLRRSIVGKSLIFAYWFLITFPLGLIAGITMILVVMEGIESGNAFTLYFGCVLHTVFAAFAIWSLSDQIRSVSVKQSTLDDIMSSIPTKVDSRAWFEADLLSMIGMAFAGVAITLPASFSAFLIGSGLVAPEFFSSSLTVEQLISLIAFNSVSNALIDAPEYFCSIGLENISLTNSGKWFVVVSRLWTDIAIVGLLVSFVGLVRRVEITGPIFEGPPIILGIYLTFIFGIVWFTGSADLLFEQCIQ